MAVRKGNQKKITKKAARAVPQFRTSRLIGIAYRIRGRLRRGHS